LVELFPERLKCFLELLPDHVDLRVVGDGLERDVRHTLIHKALPDVAVGRRLGWLRAADLRFLELSISAIGQQVVGIASAHDTGTGQRESDARRVDGDPAATPLFGNVGGGSGAAGWVEDEVAGVGNHKQASLYHLCVRLDHIRLLLGESPRLGIGPEVRNRRNWEIVNEPHECE